MKGGKIQELQLMVLPLKGHSQLMHIRITSSLFLADLHITRHVRQTECEKCIPNI